MTRREFLKSAAFATAGASLGNIPAARSQEPEIVNTAPDQIIVACVPANQQPEQDTSSVPYIRVNGTEYHGNLAVVHGSPENGSGYVSWYSFNRVESPDSQPQVISEKITPENGEVIRIPSNRAMYTPDSLYLVYEPNILRWPRRDLLRYLARVCFSSSPAFV